MRSSMLGLCMVGFALALAACGGEVDQAESWKQTDETEATPDGEEGTDVSAATAYGKLSLSPNPCALYGGSSCTSWGTMSYGQTYMPYGGPCPQVSIYIRETGALVGRYTPTGTTYWVYLSGSPVPVTNCKASAAGNVTLTARGNNFDLHDGPYNNAPRIASIFGYGR